MAGPQHAAAPDPARTLTILGFDTSTTHTAVALSLSGGVVLVARDQPPEGHRPRHTPQLLSLAQALLEQAGIGWTAVDRVAVGTGPGTFTGLRIGVATARALAQSSGAELVGISSLRLLAEAAGATAASPVLAIIDARRGEGFAAAHAGPEAALGPLAAGPAELAQIARERLPRLAAAPWQAVGEGAIRFRESLASAGVTVPPDGSPLHRVDPGVLCRIAAGEPTIDREALVPDYVRRPDAEISLPEP